VPFQWADLTWVSTDVSNKDTLALTATVSSPST